MDMEKDEYQLNYRQIIENPDRALKQIQDQPAPLAILLDSPSDIKNIGLVFRLADAARLKEIIIWNYKGDLSHDKLIKKSRSAVQHIAYRLMDNSSSLLQLTEEYQLIGAEYTNKSKTVAQTTLPKDAKPLLLCMGNERRGLDAQLIDLCYSCVHIPMLGVGSSMNMACAASILCYQILEKQNFI